MASVSASSSAENRRGNVSRGSAAANASPMASDSGFNFIHFGCWNNDGCGQARHPKTGLTSGLTRTMDKLSAVLPVINPEIVLVTGDNYYPVKPKKSLYALANDITEKQFVPDVFKSGWDCLNTILESVKQQTYVLLGNHDLEEKEGIKPKTCVIKDELTNAKDFNMVDLCNVKCIAGTMFVMFTSSIFDTDFNKDDDKNQKKKLIIETCAKQIHAFTGDEITSLANMRETAAKIINELVAAKKKECDENGTKINNLVFVCHDPLVCYKYKSADKDKKKDKGDKGEKADKKEKEGDAGEEKKEKKEKKDKKDKKDDEEGEKVKVVTQMPFGGEKYMDLLCGIIETVKPTGTYYLCADLHQYQEGTITINCDECGKGYEIKQNISGTGGAEQDDKIPEDKAKELDKEPVEGFGKYNVDYKMRESTMQFGFTKATVKPGAGGIKFDFVPVDGSMKGEGASGMFGGGRLVKARRVARTGRRHVKRVLKMTMKKWNIRS